MRRPETAGRRNHPKTNPADTEGRGRRCLGRRRRKAARKHRATADRADARTGRGGRGLPGEETTRRQINRHAEERTRAELKPRPTSKKANAPMRGRTLRDGGAHSGAEGGTHPKTNRCGRGGRDGESTRGGRREADARRQTPTLAEGDGGRRAEGRTFSEESELSEESRLQEAREWMSALKHRPTAERAAGREEAEREVCGAEAPRHDRKTDAEQGRGGWGWRGEATTRRQTLQTRRETGGAAEAGRGKRR